MNQPFNGCNSDYDPSKIVLFGAPFDGTASFRPGSRFAPAQIRVDSYGLESYSPYLDKDLEELNTVHDLGDLDFPFGNKEKVLNQLYVQSKKIFSDGKKPFLMGGEHLVTLPVVKAAFEKYPDLCLIHFDAHTDLRDQYMGEKLSHATVIHHIWQFLKQGRIYQFGIRSGLKSEFALSEKNLLYTEKFDVSTIEKVMDQFQSHPIYITLDLDVLDPSVMPGTGTPEPGGITFSQLLAALLKLKDCNIIGADVVELAPGLDSSGASTAVACKLIREILLLMS